MARINLFIVLWLLLIFITIFSLSLTACDESPLESKYILWYDQPAKDWMTEALPLGNGYLGAMFFGGISAEQIQFTEESLWAGGPGSNPKYNFGIRQNAYLYLDTVRQLMWTNKYEEAHKLMQKYFTGEIHSKEDSELEFGDFGSQQTMGDIFVKLGHGDKVENYKRVLNINNSTASVEYSIGQNQYKRSYFASYPDRILVYKFESTFPETYEIDIQTPHHIVSEEFENDILTLNGVVQDNLMHFETCLKVFADEGTIEFDDGKLTVKDTRNLVLIHTAATEYQNEYPVYSGTDFVELNEKTLAAIAAYDYRELQDRHIADYKSLFNRVNLTFNDEKAKRDIPTDQRLENYQKDQTDLDFVSLYFQYCRYLMISSSRPGSMPMNLQGKWNNSTSPSWACDYHTNINLQMNYWPAKIANLTECNLPLLNYIESLVEPGAKSAREFFNTRGWIVNIMNNPFGYTSPGWGLPWGFFPAGAAWLCRHLWEHYSFTNDSTWLRNFAYPVMESSALFWVDYLQKNEDGFLVSVPSYSPEHGGISKGTAMDHQIAWDILNNTVTAASILNIQNKDVKVFKETRDNIAPPKIGEWGQLQEWMEDVDDPENKHRHVSHLYAVYPGSQISIEKTPDLADAAQISLNARGDDGTGWSLAWKINLWARFKDGNRANNLLTSLLKPTTMTAVNMVDGGGSYSNLLCAHPPFQIDGNMGGCAGIAEMLVQSHAGIIDLLPALPDGWKSGKIEGLRVRGGHTVNFEWEEGKVKEAQILPGTNGLIKIKYNGQLQEIKCSKGQLFAIVG